MKYLLMLWLVLCCGMVSAAPRSTQSSQDAQYRAKMEARREMATASLRQKIDEDNRQARIQAAREKSPTIQGWELRTDEYGSPFKVKKTWPNPSYKTW